MVRMFVLQSRKVFRGREDQRLLTGWYYTFRKFGGSKILPAVQRTPCCGVWRRVVW